MNPYLLTTLLFITLAFLGAVDTAITSFELSPWFNALRWLRVHLITLGIMTEMLFGMLPLIIAHRYQQPRPAPRFDIWLVLNLGILGLLIGMPIVNHTIILGAGTLVFAATIMLMHQLWQMRPNTNHPPAPSRYFYLAGLAYLLLGIFIGTGLWLGWTAKLAMKVPIEVHIHANNWGFLSLVFAGLLIDLAPRFTGRPLTSNKGINTLFWLITLGALGLVLGPWTGSLYFSVPGLILHLSGTLALLYLTIRNFRQANLFTTPGPWHLVTAYTWLLAPVLIAPLIIFEAPGFPGAGIEANAPQALIYGWVLQFAFALLPYFYARILLNQTDAPLGGSWFSLITLHAGGVFLWASIFFKPFQAPLHGTAYTLWLIAFLPIIPQLWTLTRQSWQRIETALATN
ncbi:MAG TPA: hypothetical protein VLL52_08840 [Anaerolineae bacterium]|nr:hypothetical protein [Anaerolineae bacterium]